ncbi:hypothetical protein P43SY_002315 [Pythium insidiosum]|uniref:Uncharacterized protein n=1 Tax=Pythium insidiosum TaxID=114742 RepID=A0AAD5LSX1_PYTIN|nr:hypothetical protein P43SY_002315 [Pythium insidiosum]
MKKLLGGIFQKQKGDTGTPTPARSDGGTVTSPPPASLRRAAASPDAAFKTGLRSSWDTFFAPGRSATPPTSPPTAAVPDGRIPTPAKVQRVLKVFNQNLEMLMREIVMKTRIV